MRLGYACICNAINVTSSSPYTYSEYLEKGDFDKLDIQYLIDLVFITKDTKKTLLESILKEGTDF